MAFIQPCIIKNTPERRAKLELLGVIYDGYYGQNNDFIVVDYGPYNNKYDTVNTLPSNVSYHTYDGYKTFDYMDCGDNEDLLNGNCLFLMVLMFLIISFKKVICGYVV